MKEIQTLQTPSEHQGVSRISTHYAPPNIYEIYNSEDDGVLAIDTHYFEIPNQMNYERLTLELDMSANITVTIFETSYQDLTETSETGWKDCTQAITGSASLTGATSAIYKVTTDWKTRKLLKVVVAAADTTLRVQVVR
jgi:hypothetical protein